MSTTPTMREALDRVQADTMGRLHTSFPAKVIAYDVAAQTVDVTPALAREVPGDDPDMPWGFVAMPSLVNVPVMWPRAGAYALTFPLKVGDWVLIVCAEQATMLWRKRGTVNTHPGFNDPHGLNGAVALPGWFPDTQKLGNVSATDVVLGRLDTDATVRVKPDGSVVLGGELGALPVALATPLVTALKALGTQLKAAAALMPATDPATTGAKGGATAIAAAVDTWAKGVNVAATKVRAR